MSIVCHFFDLLTKVYLCVNLAHAIRSPCDAPTMSSPWALQLIFSVFSIVLVFYFNTKILKESIDGLCGIENEDEPSVSNPDAKGTIVIVFAALGLTFDTI